MIPILILAAGGSRRMRGQDKLLQPVAGQPLLRRQVLMAQDTGHPVYVALPAADHPRAATIRDLAATILIVPEAAQGMGVTMRDAVAQLPPSKAFMILLGDLVALCTADLLSVFAARQMQPDHLVWRGATAEGKPGHPVIFDASLRPQFADLAGDSGADRIVRAHQGQTCLVPLPGQRARLDLDTPEQWDAWRRTAL
ncbi:nucleotidyltransferase family protein [Yoonia vestfoldensis]|uniref:Purine catabolism protein PucB n=1 Tax=Yoonia vestfoldensis TaxID=245188 RepID=A0A1Y0EAZ6_9RHOB|nr:nucleotidyltransferase family protein [Yoonia vestfoldensis]ARU00795.1 purine catabolism protein PucB [Yoonia vestfoldensis]